jgi:hypothetical protein
MKNRHQDDYKPGFRMAPTARSMSSFSFSSIVSGGGLVLDWGLAFDFLDGVEVAAVVPVARAVVAGLFFFVAT